MSSEFGGQAPWDDGKYFCLCGNETQEPDDLCASCEKICPDCGEDKEDSMNASCDHCANVNKIHNEDCIETMRRMPDNSVNLIVTSPPYNKGYWSSNRNKNNGFGTKSRCIDYDSFEDKMNPADYDNWQRDVISECLRILKPDGSMFYNHQPIQKLHQEVNPSFIREFPLKQTIIWNRKNTPKLDKSYFFPTIEYVFWIQKTPTSRTKFNRKNALFNKVVWEISPEVNNKFPAPMPMKLVDNCILSCTDEGDLVYDPFMGSGTTAVSAKMLNRNYIGSELSSEYCKMSNKRLL